MKSALHTITTHPLDIRRSHRHRIGSGLSLSLIPFPPLSLVFPFSPSRLVVHLTRSSVHLQNRQRTCRLSFYSSPLSHSSSFLTVHTFALSPRGAPSFSYLFRSERHKVIYHRVGFRDEDGDDNDDGWPVKTISTLQYGTIGPYPLHPLLRRHWAIPRRCTPSGSVSPGILTLRRRLHARTFSLFLFLSLSTLCFTLVSIGRSRECTNSRLVIYLSVRACMRTCRVLSCRVVSYRVV